MKKLMIIFTIFAASFTDLVSQVRVDIKIGLSPASNPSTAYTLVNRDNPFQEFKFNLVHTDAQYFGGLALNIRLSTPFFVEGGIAYTKKSSQFLVDYTLAREASPSVQYMNDTEHLLKVPVNIGFSLGKVDIISGFSAQTTISQKSELNHLEGFSTESNNVKFGWQMGARYAFKRAFIGAEFQGAFNRVCEGAFVNNHSLAIRNIPGQWVFSLQYRL